MFHVNWFRQDDDGKFLWPGFGENLRVLRWIIDRCENRVGAVETAIGYLPEPSDIDTSGLDIGDDVMQSLLSVDVEQWKTEMASVGEYLESYGNRLPAELQRKFESVVGTLERAS